MNQLISITDIILFTNTTIAILSLLIFSIMLFDMLLSSTNTIVVNAHIYSNRVQEWISRQDDVKIQFTYEPERPLVYNFTELKFSVQELQTGKHLKNLVGNITVINGQTIAFKFKNIQIPDGDFVIKSKFLDTGNYQVIAKIGSKGNNSIALASFKIFVPFQPFGIINVNYLNPLILPAGLVGIIGAITIITAFLIIAKRNEEKK